MQSMTKSKSDAESEKDLAEILFGFDLTIKDIILGNDLDSIHFMAPHKYFYESCNSPWWVSKFQNTVLATLWRAIYSALENEQKHLFHGRTTLFYNYQSSDSKHEKASRLNINSFLLEIINKLADISRKSIQGARVDEESPIIQQISARLYNIGIQTQLGQKYQNIKLHHQFDCYVLPPKQEPLVESTKPKLNEYTSTQNFAMLGAMIGLFAAGGPGLVVGTLVGGGIKPVFNTISSPCCRKRS